MQKSLTGCLKCKKNNEKINAKGVEKANGISIFRRDREKYTEHVCKTLVKVIRKQMHDCLQRRNYQSKRQHGLRGGKWSLITNPSFRWYRKCFDKKRYVGWLCCLGLPQGIWHHPTQETAKETGFSGTFGGLKIIQVTHLRSAFPEWVGVTNDIMYISVLISVIDLLGPELYLNKFADDAKIISKEWPGDKSFVGLQQNNIQEHG